MSLIKIEQIYNGIQINIPLCQIIKTGCTLSIWLWKLHIVFDWFKFRPEGAKFFNIDWNPD